MNNTAIIRSYARSIQRGTRTLAQVPESILEAVAAELNKLRA